MPKYRVSVNARINLMVEVEADDKFDKVVSWIDPDPNEASQEDDP